MYVFIIEFCIKIPIYKSLVFHMLFVFNHLAKHKFEYVSFVVISE